MDFELGLINSVLDNGYPLYLETQISPDMVSSDANKVLSFIAEHWSQYGNNPTKMLVSSRFGIDFSLVPDEPVEFWANEVIRAFLWKFNKSQAEKMVQVLTTGGDVKSVHLSGDIARDVAAKNDQFGSGTLCLQEAYSPSVFKETLDELWTGIPYIETPWSQLNEKVQGGWKPEELVIFAARPGVGKSMVLLMNCVSAWKAGKRVLLVSTEMSQKAMMMRLIYFAGIYGSLGKLRRGMITRLTREHIEKQLEEIHQSTGKNIQMLVDQKGINVSLESIEAQINIFKPDLVAIDGAYLLKSKGVKETDKFRRIAEIFDRLKSIARRHKVSVVSTTQLNRGSGQGKSGKFDLDRMAFSDNLGMVADYVFFLNQDDACKKDRILKIECGKLREGDDFDDVVLNWNFDTNDFSEQPKQAKYAAPVADNSSYKSKKPVSFQKNKYGGGISGSNGFNPPD